MDRQHCSSYKAKRWRLHRELLCPRAFLTECTRELKPDKDSEKLSLVPTRLRMERLGKPTG